MSGAYIGKVGAGFCGVWAGLVAFRRNLYQLGAFFHHFSTFLGAFGVILRRFWPKTALAACFGRSPLFQHTLFSVKRSLKAFFVLPGRTTPHPGSTGPLGRMPRTAETFRTRGWERAAGNRSALFHVHCIGQKAGKSPCRARPGDGVISTQVALGPFRHCQREQRFTRGQVRRQKGGGN